MVIYRKYIIKGVLNIKNTNFKILLNINQDKNKQTEEKEVMLL